MNIESIKAAVEAAREREAKGHNCPFCDAVPNIRRLDHDFGGKTEIYDCVNDGCKVQPETCASIEADKQWNTRPAQEQADAALLALWAEYEKLQAQAPKWQPVAEAAKNPENLGKTALFKGAIYGGQVIDDECLVGVHSNSSHRTTYMFHCHPDIEVAVLD